MATTRKKGICSHDTGLHGLAQKLTFPARQGKTESENMVQMLTHLKGRKRMCKNNRVVATVDITLVFYYHNSKANLSVILNKALKTHLVTSRSYL